MFSSNFVFLEGILASVKLSVGRGINVWFLIFVVVFHHIFETCCCNTKRRFSSARLLTSNVQSD
jgi:hypothetical protein